MDTTGEAGMSGDVTMAKVPPETGLEGDDNAVTHATEESSVLSAMAADAEVTDRELGVPGDDPADADAPVVAHFADDQ